MPIRSRRRHRPDPEVELEALRTRLLQSMAAGGRLPVAKLTRPLPVVQAQQAIDEVEALRRAA